MNTHNMDPVASKNILEIESLMPTPLTPPVHHIPHTPHTPLVKKKPVVNNLYLIKFNNKRNKAYDVYDGAIVSAPNKEVARNINPRDGKQMTKEDWTKPYKCPWMCESEGGKVTDIKYVTVEYIGISSKPQGVILASYNAG